MRAGLPMGGNRITELADGIADTDAATVGQLGALSSLPVGIMLDYAGSSPPSGYLLCYGQAISRSTYASLFAVVGTTYGTGDGSTTFNLPDCRGRVAAGKDNMGGSSAGRITSASGITGTTLGDAGGAQSITLTTAEMPAHTHTGTTSNATTTGLGTPAPVNYFGSDSIYQPEPEEHNHAFTTNSAGGGGAHNNMQPTIILNKIIKVLD